MQLDLFQAATSGDTARVQELLKANRELVKSHSADGWTALHLAAFMGHQKTAEALLELGADLSSLSKNQMANQPLHAAIAGKTNPDVIAMLIDRGADVNFRAGAGVTPLHLAASRGDGPLCELLIKQGADPAAKMDDGATPSQIAAQRGHAAVAQQLDAQVQ